MQQQAAAKGANAIFGVNFDSEQVGQNGVATMITCYGTAVRVAPITRS